MRAVKIAPDATLTEMDPPEADTRAAIRELLGSPDTVDQGIYHRRAVLHTATADSSGSHRTWPLGHSRVPGAAPPSTCWLAPSLSRDARWQGS